MQGDEKICKNALNEDTQGMHRRLKGLGRLGEPPYGIADPVRRLTEAESGGSSDPVATVTAFEQKFSETIHSLVAGKDAVFAT